MIHIEVITRTAETPTSYLLPAYASICLVDSSDGVLGLLVISDQILGSTMRHLVSKAYSVHDEGLGHECSNGLTGATDRVSQSTPLCLLVATVACDEA